MSLKNKIYVLDSTLRDGAQGQGISFSVEDKIKIVKALDNLGIDYIEAGNPGSNPKDMEFFKRIKHINLSNSKVAAFGSTRKPNKDVSKDRNIISLIDAETEVVVIFGKAWEYQVTNILRTTPEENLSMIKDTISYLVSKGKEVIFDGEHFFDGYKENKEYAINCLKVAEQSGASTIVLCDTNGGTLPDEIKEAVLDVKKKIKCNVGVHCHDDIGMATANSIIGVTNGANHIQGTFIGIGERCGNANLSAIIPTLKLKLDYNAISNESLLELTQVSRYIAEVSNIHLREETPYVGNSAFAHKGGMHIDAVCKEPKAYEHIKPEIVGNKRRFLVSEVSGKSTILKEVQKIFPGLDKNSKEVNQVLDKLKTLEYEGYQFEGAEGTVGLIMRKTIGKYKPFFNLKHFRIIGENASSENDFTSSAMINVSVEGKDEISAATGDGPVNALDKALRKALEVFYPKLKNVRLVDYKVRVLDSESATEAKVRVLIESTDGIENWSTVGVSRDVIQASWIALVDSIEYKLIKDVEKTEERIKKGAI